MDVDGTDRQELTKTDSKTRIPSGHRTASSSAFQSNRDGNFEIYTMNIDGTGVTRLTKPDGRDRTELALSPPGSSAERCRGQSPCDLDGPLRVAADPEVHRGRAVADHRERRREDPNRARRRGPRSARPPRASSPPSRPRPRPARRGRPRCRAVDFARDASAQARSAALPPDVASIPAPKCATGEADSQRDSASSSTCPPSSAAWRNSTDGPSLASTRSAAP